MVRSSPEIIEVLKAINLVKKSMKPLKKTKVSADGAYKYVTLDDVLETLKKTLPKYKLGFVQTVETCNGGNSIVTTVFHEESGQYISSTALIPYEKDVFLSAIQTVGSGITYMRRYALCTIFGIVSEDDTDGGGTVPGYTEQEKDLIQKKCAERKISAESLEKVKDMVNCRIAPTIILKSIESMK